MAIQSSLADGDSSIVIILHSSLHFTITHADILTLDDASRWPAIEGWLFDEGIVVLFNVDVVASMLI